MGKYDGDATEGTVMRGSYCWTRSVEAGLMVFGMVTVVDGDGDNSSPELLRRSELLGRGRVRRIRGPGAKKSGQGDARQQDEHEGQG